MEDDAETIVWAAFAPWAARYRATLPALYARVDREKCRAGRQSRSSELGTSPYVGPINDCERCGADFPTFYCATRFCSPECRVEHKRWCRRTGRRFNRKTS